MARKPFIFIGSSTEGKKYAEALQINLKNNCESQIWDQGLFGLSDGTFDSLIKALDSFDFAVFIITGDDLLESRGKISNAPRDNVVFELGLFIGRLGRTRVYMICDNSAKPKMPSDLAGITIEYFDPPVRGTLMSALGPSSTLIKSKVDENGLRQIVELSRENYKNDLDQVIAYAIDKRVEMISIERLQNNIDIKFDLDYVSKLIESNPSKIRKAILRGNKPGVKVLNIYNDNLKKKDLIWKENFNNLNHWILNFWGSKNSTKTNRIENSEMIFEAKPGEIENKNGLYGAYIDIKNGILNEKTYEIKCKVYSSPNTTMGFQLWVHDTEEGNTKVTQPMFPKIPSISGETFKVRFTANHTNAMRIHLYCKVGMGQLHVTEVSVYEI